MGIYEGWLESFSSWSLKVTILAGTVAGRTGSRMLPTVTHPNPSPHLPEKSSRTEGKSQNTREQARVPGCGTLGLHETLQAPVHLPSGWPGTGPGLPAGDEMTLCSGVGMGEWGLSPARQWEEWSLNNHKRDRESLEQASKIMDRGEQREGSFRRATKQPLILTHCPALSHFRACDCLGEETRLGDPLPRGPLILA